MSTFYFCVPDPKAANVDAGAAGHINTDYGHGPWPEGQGHLRHLMSRVRYSATAASSFFD